MAEQGLIEFGWQGLRASIPEDWEISGISGDYKAGYLRLDDSNGFSRLELKWSQAKGKRSPDLHKVLDDYFKLVKRNLKKNSDITVKRDIPLVKDPAFFEQRDVVFFQWKGAIRAMGVIWHCHECRRILIIQVNAHLKERLRTQAAELLQSVQDHPLGYTNRWSAYGLHVEVPRRYHLDKQKLMSGYLMFSFGDGSRRLVVERYGLAEMLLKDVSLESWFRGTYRKEIRGYGFQLEALPRERDEAMQFLGQQTRLTDQIPLGMSLVMDRLARRVTLAAQLWRCSDSNRIYVVRVAAKRGAQETAQQVAESIRCHGVS